MGLPLEACQTDHHLSPWCRHTTWPSYRLPCSCTSMSWDLRSSSTACPWRHDAALRGWSQWRDRTAAGGASPATSTSPLFADCDLYVSRIWKECLHIPRACPTDSVTSVFPVSTFCLGDRSQVREAGESVSQGKELLSVSNTNLDWLYLVCVGKTSYIVCYTLTKCCSYTLPEPHILTHNPTHLCWVGFTLIKFIIYTSKNFIC